MAQPTSSVRTTVESFRRINIFGVKFVRRRWLLADPKLDRLHWHFAAACMLEDQECFLWQGSLLLRHFGFVVSSIIDPVVVAV